MNFASIFTGHSKAVTPDGYTASKFADIETYDYPQKCYDMDPITNSPLDGTNAIDVLLQNHIPISEADLASLQSWDTETNGDVFYDTIYKIIRASNPDNADDIAITIYNCNLLDTAVRGSMGYVFGYTKDNSDLIGDTSSQSSTTTNAAPSSSTPSGNLQQLAAQVLNNSNISYPLDAVSSNGSTKEVLRTVANGQPAPVTCTDGSTQGTTTASLNSNILKAILEMAQTEKIGVNALTDKCHTTGSNHYKGLAADFECEGVAFNVNKNDVVASKYGGQRNSETCSNDNHWHYDFLTRP
jgi:hypothetical protein